MADPKERMELAEKWQGLLDSKYEEIARWEQDTRVDDRVVSDAQKARLQVISAGLLSARISENSEATKHLAVELTQLNSTLEAASSSATKTAQALNRLTFWLVLVTLALVITGLYQGYQAQRQADLLHRSVTDRSLPASQSEAEANP